MISYLEGLCVHSQSRRVILDVNGVGYGLSVPDIDMPQQGSKAALWVHQVTSPDRIQLFGFASLERSDAFAVILKTAGAGPAAGLSVMSSLSMEDLRLISAGLMEIKGIKGVSKKVMKSLTEDLKGKLRPPEGDVPAPSDDYELAIKSLVSMGFSPEQSAKAVNAAQGDTAEELLAAALKGLA